MGNSQSQNQQTSQTVAESKEEEFVFIHPVVVTGFGRIFPPDKDTDTSNGKDIDEKNFSWRVVKKLSETITDYQGNEIPIIKGQHVSSESHPRPVKVCYSYVQSETFQDWLDSTDALVYLHLGVSDTNLGTGNCISLETTARRNVKFTKDHYDGEVPSPSHDTRPESLYPVLDEEMSLKTSFLDYCHTLRDNLREKFKSGITLRSCSTKPIDLTFEVSDDAGKFLCDFLYYESLNLASKRESLNPNFPKNVLFVHLPRTLCLRDADQYDCADTRPDYCESEKAEALVEVIEFIVKELLAQVYTAKNHEADI